MMENDPNTLAYDTARSWRLFALYFPEAWACALHLQNKDHPVKHVYGVCGVGGAGSYC